MLEIMLHDGPARLGKYEELKTPSIFKLDKNIPIIEDEPMPYDVPKELAEWSVSQTIENAKVNQRKGIGVIHGGKYVDLRIKCAEELDNIGITTLLMANSEELLSHPRDLIKIMVNVRETVNPNTALYFPFSDLNFIPLLTYIGADLFGDFACDFYAYLNIILTPTAKYNLEKYQIYDLELEDLKKYNRSSMDLVIREVRENIKNGTLRNLVEERCCSSPETMSALRILDRDYGDFLDKYTPLY